MRRWTDGRRWGASRVGGGGFFVYTEYVILHIFQLDCKRSRLSADRRTTSLRPRLAVHKPITWAGLTRDMHIHHTVAPR